MSENSNTQQTNPVSSTTTTTLTWAGADLEWNEEKQAQLTLLVLRISDDTSVAIEEIENADNEELVIVSDGDLVETETITIPLYMVKVSASGSGTPSTDRYIEGVFIINVSEPFNGYQCVDLIDDWLQEGTLGKGKKSQNRYPNPRLVGGKMIAKSQQSQLVEQPTATLEHLWYWTSATLEKGSSGNFYLTVKGPKNLSFLDLRLSFKENTMDQFPVPVYEVILTSNSDTYTLTNETYSVIDVVRVSAPNSEGIVSVDLIGMQPEINNTWKSKRTRINIQTR